MSKDKREKRVKQKLQDKRNVAKKTTEEWLKESKMPVLNGVRIDIDALCEELWNRPDKAFAACSKDEILKMVEEGFESGDADLGTCSAMDDGKVICVNKASRCIIEGDQRAFVCEHHYKRYQSAKATEVGKS